ncbi:MAG: Crp/Fnr family transcriptional regulator [Bacteroidota bacterium]
MDRLLRHIQASFPSISQASLRLIQSSFVRVEKKKGEFLLKQGQICRHLYFLIEGMSRSYFVKDGNEITTWFGFQDEFITSYISFFSNVPSYESIDMMSDGVLYQIAYEQLMDKRNQSVELEKVVNYFSIQYTIQLENRLLMLQTQSAAEKYRLIMQQEPHLIQHIPSKHLASYLGISRETLSRIRSGIY